MADIKWSAFPSTTGTTAGDSVVGLHSGANERFLVSSAPSASGIALWDANSNLSANSTINGYATTATAAGTTTLTVASKYQQYFTGSTTQAVVMPVTSTLVLGQSYRIINNGSGNITINASDSSLILLALPETTVIVTCLSVGVTSNAAWDAQYTLDSLSPSLNNSGITFTGSSSTVPALALFYTSSYINGVYYTNLLSGQVLANSIVGPNTIDFGNLNFSTGNFNFPWSATTSIIANNLLYTNGSLNLNTPSLTTFSLPLIQYVSGTIALTNINSLTTFSLPQLISCGGITITSATSLTTINLSNLLNSLGAISGTANALTTLTLTNLQLIYGNYSLTANALTSLSMPALVNIGLSTGIPVAGNFSPVGALLATVSMPSLVSVNGTFSPTLAALTSLTLTNLQTVTGALGLTAAALTTLSLPALTTLGAGFAPVCALATTVTLTLLANITGAVAASFAALTTLSFPAIVSVSTTWTITAANLVTFSLGSTLKSIGGNFTMTGMKLDQASVDGILVSLAALDGTNGTTAYSSKTINLSGGTSSAPSATGLAARTVLLARSCTVTTN